MAALYRRSARPIEAGEDDAGAAGQNDAGAVPPGRPTVELTSVEDGAYVEGSVELAARADDDEGVIAVRFFVDRGLLSEDTSVPFAAAWDTAAFSEGSHEVTAEAVDTDSQVAEHTVELRVDRSAPRVEVTLAGPDASGRIEVTAAVDDASPIASVTVAVDDEAPSVELTEGPPWTTSLDVSTRFGEHVIRVAATDAAGHATSADAPFEREAVDRPPTVRFTRPTDGETVAGPIQIRAETEDEGRPAVEIFVDGASIGALEPDGDLDWAPSFSAGRRTLRAVATDEGGQTGEAEISVIVDHPPRVVLQICDDECERAEEGDVVTDDDAAPATVELWIDGDRIGTDDEPPYDFEWPTDDVADGDHVVRARVTASTGATAEDTVAVRLVESTRGL